MELNDKLKEELVKIVKMSSYEKLAYIHNLVKFYKQISFSEKELVESIDDFFNRILLITRGYK